MKSDAVFTSPTPPAATNPLQRAAALLLASTTDWMRWFAGIVYGLFALGGLLMVLADAPIATVGLFAVGTFALWALWFSRTLLLHIEARLRRMPSLARDLPWALGLAAATVLLPALLLAVAGNRFAFALSSLAVAALLGLLGAMLPASWYLGLCFAPMLLALAGRAIDGVFGPGMQLPLDFDSGQLPWLAALLALVTWWRWRSIVRRVGMPEAPAWRRPMVASALHGVSWGGVFGGDVHQWRTQLPDWMWPAGRIERQGPARPVRSIRCLLGTPFAPVNARQLAIQLGVVALALVYLFDFGSGSFAQGAMTGGIVGGVCSGCAVLVLMYSQRLAAMCKRPAAEFTELALLPGLGDPQGARQRLLHAVAWSPAIALAVVLLLVLALAGTLDMRAAQSGLLLASVPGLAMMTALSCLRPLAGLPLWTIGMVSLFVPAGLLVMITAALAVNADVAAAAWPWLGPIWLLLYVILGALLHDAWRRLHARPHAFVQ